MAAGGFELRGASSGADGVIDAARMFRAVRARKRWILIPTALSFGAALAFVSVVAPHYTGVAKVLLENQESYYTRPDKAVVDPNPLFDDQAVQSQAEAVASPDIARKAVEKLGLSGRSEFNSFGLMTLLTDFFGGGDAASGQPSDRVVEAFLSRLTVFPVAKSRVLQIEFTSSDPALAARGANTMAELYLTAQMDAKKSAAKAAATWLSGRIDELRVKVAEADFEARGFSRARRPAARRQRIDGAQPAAGRDQFANRRRAHGAIGGVGQGAGAQRHAAFRTPGRRARRRARRFPAQIRGGARRSESADRRGIPHPDRPAIPG